MTVHTAVQQSAVGTVLTDYVRVTLSPAVAQLLVQLYRLKLGHFIAQNWTVKACIQGNDNMPVITRAPLWPLSTACIESSLAIACILLVEHMHAVCDPMSLFKMHSTFAPLPDRGGVLRSVCLSVCLSVPLQVSTLCLKTPRHFSLQLEQTLLDFNNFGTSV